jgi:alpha-amylase
MAYLDFLKELGYAGFRYDMVKGYSASYTGMYNKSAQPEFSVGECWDGTTKIRNWINGTKVNDTIQSAAFDFQFRYVVRNAANNGNWQALGKQNDNNWPLISNQTSQGMYRRYAVTFVENHDTEWRSNGERQDPLLKDTVAANAYLLAMPGTPCVFLKHWQAYPNELKSMIAVRKLAGITNTSNYANMRSNKDYYANVIKVGDENRLMFVVGNNTSGYEPSASQWQEVLSGYKYKYFLPRTMETAFVDMVSGEFEEAFKAKLIAISADDNAKLVYTLDGSDPTASSTKVDNGTSIDITEDCTLKVALLVGGAVTGMVTRNYTFNKVEKREITVYVNADNVGWTAVNFWSWGGDGSHSPKNSNWPGDKVTEKVSVNGKDWFAKKFTINGEDDDISFVFSTGSGSPQTVDVTNVSQTSYFEILTTKDGDKYKVKDVTSDYTGIRAIDADVQGVTKVYTLDGRLVKTAPNNADALSGMAKGIYIVNKRKFIVK